MRKLDGEAHSKTAGAALALSTLRDVYRNGMLDEVLGCRPSAIDDDWAFELLMPSERVRDSPYAHAAPRTLDWLRRRR